MKRFLFIIGFFLASQFVSASDRVVMDSLDYTSLQSAILLDSSNVLFYFELSKTNFNINYMSNRESLEQLDDVFADSLLAQTIDTIKIITSSSPDGRYRYNLALADNRAQAFKLMVRERYPLLDDVTINTGSYVTDWSELRKLLELDFDMPWWGTVMTTLDKNRDHGAIWWLLQQIGDGESWDYITQKYMSHLRMSDVTIYTVYKTETQMVDTAQEPKIDSIAQPFTPPLQVNEKINDVDTILTALSAPTESLFKLDSERHNLLAIKTNLLFDALSLVNLEVEVPIGDRWSVAGECTFPWWTFDNGKADSKRNRIQLLNASLEGRYWFGNREERPKMTGWFAGVYVGGGLYDFEHSAKGYQGEFFIMGGLSGGYAHTINKRGNLRMEYSLGVGYMQTDYRYYESHFTPNNEWHPMYNKGGRYSWVGPTKAKVSLVWMLNKRGGER